MVFRSNYLNLGSDVENLVSKRYCQRLFATIILRVFSASATTKIYGFYKFAKFLRGKNDSKIRHTINP